MRMLILKIRERLLTGKMRYQSDRLDEIAARLQSTLVAGLSERFAPLIFGIS